MNTQLKFIQKEPEILILIGDALPPGFSAMMKSVTPADIKLFSSKGESRYAMFKAQHRLAAYSRSEYGIILRDYISQLIDYGSVEVLSIYDYEPYGFLEYERNIPMAKRDTSNMHDVKISQLEACRSDLQQKIRRINPKLIVFAAETKHLKALSSTLTSITKHSNRLEQVEIIDKLYPVVPIMGFTSYLKSDRNKVLISGSVSTVQKIVDQKLHTGEFIDNLLKNTSFPQTIKGVNNVVNDLLYHRNKSYPIAVDIETNTLSPFGVKHNQKIISVAFAWFEDYQKPGSSKLLTRTKAASFMIDHKLSPFKSCRSELMLELSKILNNPELSFIPHNAQFELQWIRDLYGFSNFRVTDDTMIMSYMLSENRKGHYGLKALVGEYLPEFSNYEKKMYGELEDLVSRVVLCERKYGPCALNKKCEKQKSIPKACDIKHPGLKKYLTATKSNVNFEDVDPKILLTYNALDAIVTLKLGVILSKEMVADIESEEQFPKLYSPTKNKSIIDCYHTYMMPGVNVLSKMQYTGFKVDTEYLEYLREALNDRVTTYAKLLKDFAGVQPDEIEKDTGLDKMQKFLEGHGVTPQLTDANKLAINAAAQASYAAQAIDTIYAKEVKEFINALSDFKTYEKGLGMLESHYLSKICSDGRIHPSFHPTGTATGRLSSSNPNFQNLPKMVGDLNFKKALIPDPGYQIVDVDYASAEIRVLAWYSKDPNLISLLNKGLDMHSFVGAKVAGVEYEFFRDKVKKEKDPHYIDLRGKAKSTVFALTYGGSAWGIANNINTQAGGIEVITVAEVEKIIDSFFDLFPRTKWYMDVISDYAVKYKFIKMRTGRKRRFHDTLTPDCAYQQIGRIRRQAMNTPIQGTSSDLVVGQLVEVAQNIHLIRGIPLITVHDSIVSQVQETDIEVIKEFYNYWMCKRVQERYPDFPVEFKVEINMGPNYGETHEI